MSFKQASYAVKRVLHPIIRRACIVDYVLPAQGIVRTWVNYMASPPDRKSTSIENMRILDPAQNVTVGTPESDPFIPVGKYYRDGTIPRDPIFVCDVPGARLHVGTGMVCTRDWEFVAEMESRVEAYTPPFRRRRPTHLQKRSDNCSTVILFNAGNIGHWFIDCLPRVHSLAKIEPTKELTLLMPDTIGDVRRESLEAVLPPNFRVEYFPGETWFQLENLHWASLVSSRLNYMLPAEYLDSIRKPLFAKYGLPEKHTQTSRLYISRRRAGYRKVTNDEDVCRLLERYGFTVVDMDKYSLREQVEMFHRADIVIGPHGAGLTSILFSGKIKVVVFFATQAPQNHYHTMAKGLGQDFYFLTDNKGEEDNFAVDVAGLEKILQGQLGLSPGAVSTPAV